MDNDQLVWDRGNTYLRSLDDENLKRYCPNFECSLKHNSDLMLMIRHIFIIISVKENRTTRK